jgi:hypothetical protein
MLPMIYFSDNKSFARRPYFSGNPSLPRLRLGLCRRPVAGGHAEAVVSQGQVGRSLQQDDKKSPNGAMLCCIADLRDESLTSVPSSSLPRPSTDLHHSFSFPSGHTNGAVMSLGFLLFGLVAPLMEAAQGLSSGYL